MPMNRRGVLTAGAALAVLPRTRAGRGTTWIDPTTATTLRDPRMQALAHAALEAARSAGAHYADVRMTQTVGRSVGASQSPVQTVDLALTVRALAGGYWGWAATPVLSLAEAVRVARRATEFARHSATRVPGGNVELDARPVVTGEWATPVEIDPFTLDMPDLQDWLAGMSGHIGDLIRVRGADRAMAWTFSASPGSNALNVHFTKQERLFAATDGTLVTQTIVATRPNCSVGYKGAVLSPTPTFNMPAQGGWERVTTTPVLTLLERAMDEIDAAPPPPPEKVFDIGRYDVVFGANAMAALLSATLAPATQLDSVVGDDAYAGYLSFLGPDPLRRLGTPVASPLVTITAERSNPVGMATVKWDDEGVAPRDFTLVRKGLLENYQTTRANAAQLRPWYAQHGQPSGSLGCAMASSALGETGLHTPNLTLQPGAGHETEASLVADLEHGLYIPAIPAPGAPRDYGPSVFRTLGMDWQYAQGFITFTGIVPVEIRKGKPVARTPRSKSTLAIIFRTAELWKNIEVLGGPASLIYAGGFVSFKGNPVQVTAHSIGAVPARIKQLAVIDTGRMT